MKKTLILALFIVGTVHSICAVEENRADSTILRMSVYPNNQLATSHKSIILGNRLFVNAMYNELFKRINPKEVEKWLVKRHELQRRNRLLLSHNSENVTNITPSKAKSPLLINPADIALTYKFEALNDQLYVAVFNNRIALVTTSIDNGADVNGKSTYSNYGNTMLHMAVANRNEEITKILLAKGADVNASNNNNWTPLHIAVANGYTNLVKILVGHNALVDFKANNNITPLHLAAMSKNKEIAEILLKIDTEKKNQNQSGPAETKPMSSFLQSISNQLAIVCSCFPLKFTST